MNKIIDVDLGARSYSIVIEAGLLNRLQHFLASYNHGEKWVIISHPLLMALYGDKVQRKLREAGFQCFSITVPNSERSKTHNQYLQLISQMFRLQCDRSTIVLALGGGVVGDLAGFTAATFMRGINYFQIPTTLLSMVDSAIGGKTGINTIEGKNLVGSFHQPRGVFIDTEVLTTLPQPEIISGLAEIIKYGAIQDVGFLWEVSRWLDRRDQFPLEQAIERSSAIKANIVSRDERENSLRIILNFGHTFGHALEAYLGYGALRHGEAVAYGMIAASYLSEQLGLLPPQERDFLVDTIRKLPLPPLPKLEAHRLHSYLRRDKKSQNGKLNFILLNGLGKATVCDQVHEEMINQSIKALS